MSLPRYSEYKASGVQWLGEVPSHWDLVPLKHVADFVNGDAFKPSEWVDSGIPIIRIQNLNGGGEFNFASEVESRYLVREGDLLFGWSGNRGTSFGPFLWKRPGTYALNQHIFRVEPRLLDRNELYWTLKAVTSHVEDQAHGIIGMVHVTKGDLGAIVVPVPPPVEQTGIAAFLERETAKIDALIAEQEKLIALLAEKRQATISHAVTKGLNPDAPMKDSGVPWLGEMPAHWDLKSIKRLVVSIEQGWSPQCDADAIGEDDGFGVLKVGCVNGGTFNHAENKRLPDDLQPLTQYALKEGDLLISRANTRELVGSAAVVPRDYPNLMLCDKLYRLRLDVGQCTPEFLAAFLLSSLGRSQIEVAATGASSSMLNIGQSVILDMPVPLPSPSEQCKIMDALQQELSHLRALSYDALSMIELLKERRSVLIAAAVTGQIDVRGAVSAEAA